MSDLRNKLQSMFDPSNRFNNFGDVLMRLHIRGFRCHSSTVIDLESPISAFCGLNGTGKSTILQLASAAYKHNYYIKDFLVVGTLDPSPFNSNASVEYKFWQNDRTTRPVTLSRNHTTKRWQGYNRRPKRKVLFGGVGLYLPKIEQRDFIVRNAGQLVVSATSDVTKRIKEWTCKILGHNYDTISSNTVTHFGSKGTVITVKRSEVTYSEAHMGYGEGRIQYLINALEILPEKSLVLIEEPETSLHPSAQYELGRYLIDVACERRHQIMLTTHSEFILEALPSASRIYLKKTIDGVRPIPGMTSLQAKSLMTEGNVKALHILVEDECAKSILTELLRRGDPTFLSSVGLHIAGTADTIAKAVRALKETGLPIAAVRDGDQAATPTENIFKLPGNKPPEKEIFESNAVVAHIEKEYGINFKDFNSGLTGVDHHEWLKRLGERVNQNELALLAETARAYVGSLSEAEIVTLIDLLKEASRK